MARRGPGGLAILGVVALVGAAGAWMLLADPASAPGRLIVEPRPPETRIRVGGLEVTGTLDTDLPPGPTTVHLAAPGHRPQTLELSLTPGAETRVTPRLQPLPEDR